MITVPRGKLQQNYNLVYDALETSRLEGSRPVVSITAAHSKKVRTR